MSTPSGERDIVVTPCNIKHPVVFHIHSINTQQARSLYLLFASMSSHRKHNEITYPYILQGITHFVIQIFKLKQIVIGGCVRRYAAMLCHFKIQLNIPDINRLLILPSES